MSYSAPLSIFNREPTRNRLKIAFLHQPWSIIHPPVAETAVADSVGLVTNEIARRLALSHDVIEYCRLGNGQAKWEHSGGVEYRRTPNLFDRIVSRAMEHAPASLKNPRQPFFSSGLFNRRFIGEILNDLSKEGCDIVHIQNFSQFIPLVRARLPKARIVLHMHCEWLVQLDEAMIARRLNAADLVLGVSKFITAGVHRRFPSMAQRCRHLYNGIDIKRFTMFRGAVRPKPKEILYVGRLSPEKGVHILLDAFRIALAHHPDAHLTLIGPVAVPRPDMMIKLYNHPLMAAIEPYFKPGAYAELLRAKLGDLPSCSVSFFNKGMPFAELLPYYHLASIFVFPSIVDEAFGMPVLEAMAAQTAIVAARSGGVPEIVEEGRSGLVVERADVQGLAEAILRLLSDSNEREAMAEAGYERASTMFTWDQITTKLLGEYERILTIHPDNRRSAQPG